MANKNIEDSCVTLNTPRKKPKGTVSVWHLNLSNLSAKKILFVRTTILLSITMLILGCDRIIPEQQTFITDDQGRALILHGLNTSSSAKSDPNGLPWIEQSDVDRAVNEWGFNIVRYLIFWEHLEPSPGVYNEAYMDAVEQRLDWYHNHGAYVMLDMHQDLYSRYFGGDGAPEWAIKTDGVKRLFKPEDVGQFWWLLNLDPALIRAFTNFWAPDSAYPELQAAYIATWERVVSRFKDHPAVIGYDLMNEPHAGNLIKSLDGSFESQWLADLYEKLIPRIRQLDQENWIFFEPQAFTNSFGKPSSLPRVTDALSNGQRLVYAPHLYPFLVHENVGYTFVDKLMINWWTRSRTEELELHQTPLLVGEFGVSDSMDGVNDYLDDALKLFDDMGSGWTYWSNDRDVNGWSLVDHTYKENPKVDKLVRTYPWAIAGKPLQFGFDPDTKTFELAFKSLETTTGPTIIFVPSRHYPNGWEIESTDPSGSWSYSFDSARQRLSIWHDPNNEIHTITIKARP